jgi:hypothetical protein
VKAFRRGKLLEKGISLPGHPPAPFDFLRGVDVFIPHFCVREMTYPRDLSRVSSRVVIVERILRCGALQIMIYKPQESPCTVWGGKIIRQKQVAKAERRVKMNICQRLDESRQQSSKIGCWSHSGMVSKNEYKVHHACRRDLALTLSKGIDFLCARVEYFETHLFLQYFFWSRRRDGPEFRWQKCGFETIFDSRSVLSIAVGFLQGRNRVICP